MLLLPILFLAISLVDLFTAQELTSTGLVAWNVWVNIFFINCIHITFFIPAFASRSFRDHWLSQSKMQFYSLTAIISFCFFFYINLYSVGIYKPENSYTKILEWLSLFLVATLPAFHALRQSYGISRLVENSDLKNKYKKIDFGIYHILLLVIVIARTQSMIFSESFNIQNSILNYALLAIASSGFLFFLFSQSSLKKKLFQFRLLLWPISHFSVIGGFLNSAVHGTEYGYISYKMSGSIKEKNIWIVVFALTIIASIIFLITMVEVYNKAEKIPVTIPVLLVSNILLSFGQTHYIIDTLFFSDKSVGRKLKPLLD